MIFSCGVQSDASVRGAEQGDKLVGARAGSTEIFPRGRSRQLRSALKFSRRLRQWISSWILTKPAQREFIARLAPDVCGEGRRSGSQENAFADDDAVTAAGGQVVRMPLEPGYSTSRLLERITQLQA